LGIEGGTNGGIKRKGTDGALMWGNAIGESHGLNEIGEEKKENNPEI